VARSPSRPMAASCSVPSTANRTSRCEGSSGPSSGRQLQSMHAHSTGPSPWPKRS
jgi:hypothetical protein